MKNMTDVTIFTRNHCYRGSIDTGGQRVADMLNDPNTSTIEVRDVAIRRLEREMRCSDLPLRKRSIVVVMLTGNHEAPLRRANNRVRRREYDSLVVLPGVTVSGIAHMPGRILPQTLIHENSTLSPFIALTDVTIRRSDFGPVAGRPSTAILQREWIEAFQLSEHALMV